eukprot:10379032-Heterocapsa_arctica.AAC.1
MCIRDRVERESSQSEAVQQNKKPRTEDKQAIQSNLLTMLCKRNKDQDHYRNVQTTKKVKADKKTERVTPTM